MIYHVTLTFLLVLEGALAQLSSTAVSIMRPSCIRQGKCIDELGRMNATMCCSGMCDEENGCFSSTEASSIMMRMNLAGSPFVCRPESFFGVRSKKSVCFNAGKIGPDCLCPAGKPCVVGDGETPLCSSRFWLGYCDPANSACVPRILIDLHNEKRIFLDEATGALTTPETSFGKVCTSNADCPAESRCQGNCEITIAELLIDGTTAAVGTQLQAAKATRMNNPPGSMFCTAGSADNSVALGNSCMCDNDCAAGSCVLPGFFKTDPQDDLSSVGSCLLAPLETCNLHTECLYGHRCETTSLGKQCTLPAGSSTPCTEAAQCATGNCVAGLCKLPNGSACLDDIQCESGYSAISCAGSSRYTVSFHLQLMPAGRL